MNQNQPSSTGEQTNAACCLCGQLKQPMYRDACSECISQTLLKHLPNLKRALEAKYGSTLDQWLATGRFLQAHWKAKVDLNVSHERLNSFVREIVRGAISKGEIELSLPSGESWKPIQINQLMDSVYEQCEEDFRRLIGSLLEAISNAPTGEVERELIELVSGKKRVNKRYIRDEAISAVVLTSGTPLPLPVKALIELRYRADCGRLTYTKVMDGAISSVWNEVKESLPTEVAKLICANASF